MATSTKTIFVLGDRALVEEYGLLCVNAGYNLMGRLNKYSSKKNDTLSFLKKNSTPSRAVSVALELTNLDNDLKRKNLALLEKQLPASAVILSSSVTVTVTEQQSWLKYPDRIVGMCAFPTLASKPLIEVASSVHTERKFLSTALHFLQSLGKETSVIQDRIGMVIPRIICSLINESCFAAAENIASAEDIDTAMKLGTNYPHGPFEWADTIGVDHVFAVLTSVHKDLGEERYRIAPLLKQMALGKQWWKT